MKKLILLTFIFSAGCALSQTAADKKIQAGFGFTSGLNMNKTATKLMATNGVGTNVGIGLNLNYNFSQTIGFFTGLDFEFDKNKVKPAGDAAKTYYLYNDTEILQYDINDTTSSLYNLTERKQKINYITIPTMLLFRTDFYGDLRFFGKFGLRTSIPIANKMTDEGYKITNSGPVEEQNENFKSQKLEISPLRSSLGMALGTEWNFSGSTSISAEIGYYYGFIPIYYSGNKNMFYLDDTFTVKTYSNKMKQSQLQLRVAFLF